MKFTDVLEGHIYNVLFSTPTEPVRQPEFDSKHLALVLKKNNDKSTVVVMPLTTSNNGNSKNKENIGILSCLPKNFQTRGDSFAVFNQVRTINVSRMIVLKENQVAVQCKLDKDVYLKLLKLAVKDLSFNLKEDKIDFFYNLYFEEVNEKIIYLLYDLKKEMENSTEESTEILSLKKEIKNFIERINNRCILSEKNKKDGLEVILTEFLN